MSEFYNHSDQDEPAEVSPESDDSTRTSLENMDQIIGEASAQKSDLKQSEDLGPKKPEPGPEIHLG